MPPIFTKSLSKRFPLNHPITQGAVVGASGAIFNRLGVMLGYRLDWTPFETTLAIELVIPFICTYIICAMLKQKALDCFYMSAFASLVGGLTTLLTFNWD